jgi:hypothetical protein
MSVNEVSRLAMTIDANVNTHGLGRLGCLLSHSFRNVVSCNTVTSCHEMSRGDFVAGFNAGGHALNSPDGSLFQSGSDVAAGAREAYINPDGESAGIPNAATWELPLFNSMEYTFKPNFDLAYTLPLTVATTSVVEVELLFAELDRGIGPDERRFDVFINSELALKNFDIFTMGGGRKRAVRASVFLSPAPTTVVVTFGKIVRKNKPTISSVAVYNVHGLATTTQGTTTTAATPNTTPTITKPTIATPTPTPTTVPSITPARQAACTLPSSVMCALTLVCPQMHHNPTLATLGSVRLLEPVRWQHLYCRLPRALLHQRRPCLHLSTRLHLQRRL